MKTDDFLNTDIFKQFKTPDEFNNFFSELHQCCLETMLEGELDAYLGYSKNYKAEIPNACNGHLSNKIVTSLGEAQIKVQSDKDSSFNPMIVPKRKNIIYVI